MTVTFLMRADGRERLTKRKEWNAMGAARLRSNQCVNCQKQKIRDPCYLGMYLISYYFKYVYHNYLKLHNINLEIVVTNLSNPCAL